MPHCGLGAGAQMKTCHFEFIKPARNLKTEGLRCGSGVCSGGRRIVRKGAEPRVKPKGKKTNKTETQKKTLMKGEGGRGPQFTSSWSLFNFLF